MEIGLLQLEETAKSHTTFVSRLLLFDSATAVKVIYIYNIIYTSRIQAYESPSR